MLHLIWGLESPQNPQTGKSALLGLALHVAQTFQSAGSRNFPVPCSTVAVISSSWFSSRNYHAQFRSLNRKSRRQPAHEFAIQLKRRWRGTGQRKCLSTE